MYDSKLIEKFFLVVFTPVLGMLIYIGLQGLPVLQEHAAAHVFYYALGMWAFFIGLLGSILVASLLSLLAL